MAKPMTGPDLKQEETAQIRFPGSEVLGMEYTTAFPSGSRNAAQPILQEPNPIWPYGFFYRSHTKGKMAE